MMQNIVMPINSPHTYIDMFHPPYGKNLIPTKAYDSSDDFKLDIDILFDTFLDGYNDFLSGKMTKGEDFYKSYGIPGPSQYKAFNEFYNLFSKYEFEFLNKPIFYFYDMTMMNDLSKIGTLEFIENLTKFDFDKAGQEKKVVFASGSFWEKKLDIRERMISYFEILHKNGIEVQIYTNSKETEPHMDRLSNMGNGKSRFGLKKRIPIHFIRCGNDYFFIEFPHTEDIIVRLNMFLDLNNVELKPELSKADVVQFFDNLINKALE